jgi:hypothetical protein
MDIKTWHTRIPGGFEFNGWKKQALDQQIMTHISENTDLIMTHFTENNDLVWLNPVFLS